MKIKFRVYVYYAYSDRDLLEEFDSYTEAEKYIETCKYSGDYFKIEKVYIK